MPERVDYFLARQDLVGRDQASEFDSIGEPGAD